MRVGRTDLEELEDERQATKARSKHRNLPPRHAHHQAATASQPRSPSHAHNEEEGADLEDLEDERLDLGEVLRLDALQAHAAVSFWGGVVCRNRVVSVWYHSLHRSIDRSVHQPINPSPPYIYIHTQPPPAHPPTYLNVFWSRVSSSPPPMTDSPRPDSMRRL